MSANPNSDPSIGQVTELSEADLEAISGGVVNVSFTMMMVEESSEFVAQEFASGGSSGMSISGQRRRSLFGLQFSGTFESMGHFSAFFSKFTSFFGRR